MPSDDPRVRSLGAAVGAVAKKNRHDPRLPSLRQQLHEALAEARIRELVDQAPPLSVEVKARLAVLLLADRPSRTEASAA